MVKRVHQSIDGAVSDHGIWIQQQDQLTALLANIDDGVGDAQSKLAGLASMLAQIEREAANLSAETGPALVSALVQVKDAAAHAAERAREAIEA